MRNLAVIPARGGSKRIPRKNIRPFLGKPIINYSIEVALESKLFDMVMVSTDDDEIAAVAREAGAEVPFMRSAATSDDHATLADVIDEVRAQIGGTWDYLCCILPTAPLLTTEVIHQGYGILLKDGVDSVRPVVRFSYPIQRALRMVDGRITMMHPEYRRTRSQDLETVYHDAGQFYWMRFDQGFNSKGSYGFEVIESQVQDIDTFEDWKLAEIKFQMQQNARQD